MQLFISQRQEICLLEVHRDVSSQQIRRAIHIDRGFIVS